MSTTIALPGRRIPGLVRSRAGRLSWLRVAALAGCVLPGVHLAWRLAGGTLGSRPVTELIHGTGDWTVVFLLLTLGVTPARAVFNWPAVIELRRMLGVTAACYAAAHLLLYVVDQKWQAASVVREIALRFYLTIGFVAMLGLWALGITSTDGWQRRLGPRWKSLHRLVFPIGTLALLHYALQSKADVSDAVFAAGVFLWLVLWRRIRRRWQARLWLLPVLALMSAALAALIEASWYAVASKRIGFWDVLQANAGTDAGIRPAQFVLLAGVGLFLAVALARLLRWARTLRTTAPAAS